MTLLELIKANLEDEEKLILPLLEFSKSDTEIIESMNNLSMLDFKSNYENQETE